MERLSIGIIRGSWRHAFESTKPVSNRRIMTKDSRSPACRSQLQWRPSPLVRSAPALPSIAWIALIWAIATWRSSTIAVSTGAFWPAVHGCDVGPVARLGSGVKLWSRMTLAFVNRCRHCEYSLNDKTNSGTLGKPLNDITRIQFRQPRQNPRELNGCL